MRLLASLSFFCCCGGDSTWLARPEGISLKKNRKENHKTQDISGLIFLFCVNGSHGYSWFGTGFNVIVNRKSVEYCSEYDDGVPDQFV